MPRSPALFLALAAACASQSLPPPPDDGTGAPFATPGLPEIWSQIPGGQRAALGAIAHMAGGDGVAVPSRDFAPRGPNVTVHVARATRRWLEGVALYPKAIDRFLANSANFFPDCTICAGVRLAFESYRRDYAALHVEAAVKRWLRGLEGTLDNDKFLLLISKQSNSQTLAAWLRDAYEGYLKESLRDPGERNAFAAAAGRMDDYTTEFGRETDDPNFAGKPCPLCQAVTTGLPSD